MTIYDIIRQTVGKRALSVTALIENKFVLGKFLMSKLVMNIRIYSIDYYHLFSFLQVSSAITNQLIQPETERATVASDYKLHFSLYSYIHFTKEHVD